MKNNALKINEKDNVAIAIREIAKGETIILNEKPVFVANESIASGHKIATEPIKPGEMVFRYGEAIVKATRVISRGEWVHIHNTEPIS
ncbi:MAG: UxaA family hydrolase [Deltaproteobacteria bacterium]|nr:UxaA family hydrolase [Deltaproteobacteria bacterium]